MKTTTKTILAAALVATLPLGAFAYDGHKNHNDHEDHNDGFFEDHDDKEYLEKYKDANYEFEGDVEKRPKNSLNGTWVISGIKVIVNDKTFISHEKRNIKVGDEVEVIAKRENGTITALDLSED